VNLAETQDLFAALTMRESIDPVVRDTILEGDARLSSAERACIYSDMYLARLVDALREDYPLLARLVGNEQFFALAAEYVQAHPSRSPTLAHLGRVLSGFLHGRAAQRPDLAALSALEWARAEAFVAPDAEPQDVAALQALGEQLPTARLELVPSVRVLSLEYDVAPLWSDLDAGRDPSAPRPGPAFAVVWRRGFDVFHAPIASDERAALALVQQGKTVGEACEAFTGAADPVRAALDALSSWFGEGMVSGVSA
jgi:Putative DNA-binding domain